MRWPLRYQLLLPSLTLLLGVVGISTWSATASAERARHQVEGQVRHVAHTLIGPPPIPIKSAVVLEQMKRLSGADYLLRAGGEQVSTLPAEATELPPAEAVVEDWQTLRLGPRVTIGGVAYLGSGVRLPPSAATPEGGTLYILYPESLWRGARWEAVRPSLVLGGFAGVASLALAVGVSRRLVRRVQELERRTRLIASGVFDPMPLPRRDDELRDLGQSVNEMAAQLARLQETVRRTERLRLLGQVSDGLAHQLRNGLTGARLAVQLHARECPGGDEALDVALRQLTLLEAHLKRFLELGRDGPTRREPCSLRTIVEEAAALLRPRCRHARIDLRWRPTADAFPWEGDAAALGQVALNLLTNAVEAAGPGGWVEVGLRRDAAGRIVWEVSDSGPGPAPEVAARLFEPFVTGKPEGVGLGLAVARQIVEAHGGRIAWERDGSATCFRVEFPCPGESPCPSSSPSHV